MIPVIPVIPVMPVILVILVNLVILVIPVIVVAITTIAIHGRINSTAIHTTGVSLLLGVRPGLEMGVWPRVVVCSKYKCRPLPQSYSPARHAAPGAGRAAGR